MALYAVLSDIHANCVALEAVEQDARDYATKHGLSSPRFICLGDVVDYGPQPNECMGWVRKNAAKRVVLGNHDECVIKHHYHHPRLITQDYWAMTAWTRLALESRYKAWMGEWAKEYISPHGLRNFTLVHASLGEPQNDGRIETEMDAKNHFPEFGPYRYVLFGHTHYQGYYRQKTDKEIETGYAIHQHPNRKKTNNAWQPIPVGEWRSLPVDGKMMLNPGSVGQPRSHAAPERYAGRDNRAAYMFLNVNGYGTGEYQFRRVKYDVEETIRLIQEEVTLQKDEQLRNDHDVYWRDFPEPESFDENTKKFKAILENLEIELEKVKNLLIQKLRSG